MKFFARRIWSLVLFMVCIAGCSSQPDSSGGSPPLPLAGAVVESPELFEQAETPETPLPEALPSEKPEIAEGFQVLSPGEEIPLYLIPPELPPGEPVLPVSWFREIWAYVVAGREDALNRELPISDIGYFGADVNSYGKLVDVPDRRNIKDFPGRVHMVVKCDSYSLSHFVLLEGRPERRQLIADLLREAQKFDGLQIDFEYILPGDGASFFSFLTELRAGLKGKVFSVALKARTGQIDGDVYSYQKIAPVVDRILVMAYDEHWSTSAPGPIASMEWCRRVADYALRVIGKEKLIMGLPFYGRAWGSFSPNKAYIFSSIENIKREQGIKKIERETEIPTFRYETIISMTVYYEDDRSLAARLSMYQSMGVRAAGFWRLGQESPGIWNFIRLE